MSMSQTRRRAYLYGALAGAFTVLAFEAGGDEDRGLPLIFAAFALGSGSLAVAAEERAQTAE